MTAGSGFPIMTTDGAVYSDKRKCKKCAAYFSDKNPEASVTFETEEKIALIFRGCSSCFAEVFGGPVISMVAA